MPKTKATKPAKPTDWDDARRLWRGRMMSIPAFAVGLPRARWHNVQRLLQAVLWFDIKQEGCWAGNAALMVETDLSKSTLSRARHDAMQIDLLGIERRDNTGIDGGRLPDRLKVDLKRLAELVEPATSERGSRACQSEASTPPDDPSEAKTQSEHPKPQYEQAKPQYDIYIEEETPELNHNNQPPPPTAGRSQPAHKAWRVVEGELFRLGLNQAAAACRDARSAGLSPAEVHALAGHWRARCEAWGQHTHAVLRRQLQRATPGQLPDEGWPEYDRQASTVAARRADDQTAKLRRERRQKLHAECNALIEPLTLEQRGRLGTEAKRRRPELSKGSPNGRRVFEEGVVPLLAEWGEAGLQRWLSEAA